MALRLPAAAIAAAEDDGDGLAGSGRVGQEGGETGGAGDAHRRMPVVRPSSWASRIAVSGATSTRPPDRRTTSNTPSQS